MSMRVGEVRRPRATPLWGLGIKSSLAGRNNCRVTGAYSRVRVTRHCTSIPWVNGLQSRRASLSLARIASCFVRDDTRASRVLVLRRSPSAAIPLGGTSNVASVSPRHIGDLVRPLIPK